MIKKYNSFIVLGYTVFSLSGCIPGMTEGQLDQQTCAGYGFIPGSESFSRCLQKEQLSRRNNSTQYYNGYYADTYVAPAPRYKHKPAYRSPNVYNYNNNVRQNQSVSSYNRSDVHNNYYAHGASTRTEEQNRDELRRIRKENEANHRQLEEKQKAEFKRQEKERDTAQKAEFKRQEKEREIRAQEAAREQEKRQQRAYEEKVQRAQEEHKAELKRQDREAERMRQQAESATPPTVEEKTMNNHSAVMDELRKKTAERRARLDAEAK